MRSKLCDDVVDVIVESASDVEPTAVEVLNVELPADVAAADSGIFTDVLSGSATSCCLYVIAQ